MGIVIYDPEDRESWWRYGSAGVPAELSPGWSQPSVVETLCERITVMDACKHYFSYKCTTFCGFPSITLEGTAHDWALLRWTAVVPGAVKHSLRARALEQPRTATTRPTVASGACCW